MHSAMHLYPIDGAVHRVGKNDTAFSYRDAKWSAVFVGVDPDPDNNERIIGWTKEYWDAVHPHSGGGAYVNFICQRERTLLVRQFPTPTWAGARPDGECDRDEHNERRHLRVLQEQSHPHRPVRIGRVLRYLGRGPRAEAVVRLGSAGPLPVHAKGTRCTCMWTSDLYTLKRRRPVLPSSCTRRSKKVAIRGKDSHFRGCGLQLRLATVVACAHSGAARTANPPRGGGAIPRACDEKAGSRVAERRGDVQSLSCVSPRAPRPRPQKKKRKESARACS
jgi:hypothetical protein